MTIGNAVFNYGLKPSTDEFGDYSEAFHDAARALYKGLVARQIYSDTEVCPVFFCYRHALELGLKGVVQAHKALLAKGQAGTHASKLYSSHKLTDLLPDVARAIEYSECDWFAGVDFIDTMEDIEGIVKYVDSIDPLSFAFRYPVNKKGDASHRLNTIVSLSWVAERLDPTLELLLGVQTCLRERTVG